MTIINFKNYVASKQPVKANVTQSIMNAFTDNYMLSLSDYNVDVQDPIIAFDVATIQFLMRGMAHRSQGETHPSQILLDKLKERIIG
jgi:hypothetical protein